MSAPADPGPVLLFDGVCGLCNRAVQFLLDRDREGRLRFTPLQSEIGQAVLERHGLPRKELSTAVLVRNLGTPEESVAIRSRAMLGALREIGGGWGALARVLLVVPAVLTDLGYRVVARLRYAFFGRLDSCRLPKPEERSRFL
ncbi:MAG: DCC1-like thiol-disulfide oxidoreductase family protein [Planctomycetota bacterium]